MRQRVRKKLERKDATAPRCARCENLARDNETLRDENQRLRAALEQARRSGKRQAAPFSKGPPKNDPKRPGRKKGKDYGPRARRPPPPPEHVDEVLDAPLPEHCPDCGGHVEPADVLSQFQTELPPVKIHVVHFRVHVGHCVGCGTRVQGRHPRQTSNALGAAASQLGPRASAFAAELNKTFGLSCAKVSRLFHDHFGISLTRSGVYVATTRVARVLEPTYEAMKDWIRDVPVISPDETGWKVGGYRAWLWVAASPELTVYAIRRGRGFAEAAELLGEDFPGVLVRDGWAPYRGFQSAWHQTCLAHLIRRCHELLEVALRGAARVPHAVLRILERALALRDRRDAGTITPHGLAVEQGKLEAALDRLLTWQPRHDENRKLLEHLRTERDALFTFLARHGVPATNWWSETGLRPAVVMRKACGGNRTWAGAHVQEVLVSVLRTAHQRGLDALDLIAGLLVRPQPAVATVLAPTVRRVLPGRPAPPG